MMHLSLFINNRFVLEKTHQPSLRKGKPPGNAEGINVDLGQSITIRELIEKTREFMGAKLFS
eukprot:47615-Eustigmatos_ZCMA.PRE.1